MGQRLNIEIKISGRVVANAYYHWSAYTGESLDLVNKIITNFDSIKEENPILYGVQLLQLTGAGLERKSVDWAYKNIPNFSLNEMDTIKYKYNIEDDRNNGLIAITEKDMEETRFWQEGYVCIDVNEKLVDFKVFCHYDKKELEDWDVGDGGELNLGYPIEAIPFDKFLDFSVKINELMEKDAHNDVAYKVEDNHYIQCIS